MNKYKTKGIKTYHKAERKQKAVKKIYWSVGDLRGQGNDES